jgi:hypothetical protein
LLQIPHARDDVFITTQQDISALQRATRGTIDSKGCCASFLCLHVIVENGWQPATQSLDASSSDHQGTRDRSYGDSDG